MTSQLKCCKVCSWTDENEVKYRVLFGPWKKRGNIEVHYYCLLTSFNIPQRGKDSEGISGFLVKDIENAIKEIRTKACHYCGCRNASIKCSFVGCDRYFHYHCGTTHSCITNFSGKFESYCNRHVPDKNMGKRHGENENCYVCFEPLGTYHPATSIISSCCFKFEDWVKCFVHKHCIASYVENAGYDSICINCPMDGLTKEEWQNEMRRKGIFLPMRMASWETDGRFDEQVKNKCGYSKCQYSGSKDVWTCFVCGCFPMHLKCARVSKFDEYYCPRCYDQSFVQRVPKI